MTSFRSHSLSNYYFSMSESVWVWVESAKVSVLLSEGEIMDVRKKIYWFDYIHICVYALNLCRCEDAQARYNTLNKEDFARFTIYNFKKYWNYFRFSAVAIISYSTIHCIIKNSVQITCLRLQCDNDNKDYHDINYKYGRKSNFHLIQNKAHTWKMRSTGMRTGIINRRSVDSG